MKIPFGQMDRTNIYTQILLKNGAPPIFVFSGNTVEFHYLLCSRRAAEWRFVWSFGMCMMAIE